LPSYKSNLISVILRAIIELTLTERWRLLRDSRFSCALIQEVLPIKRIPLGRSESGVADDPAEFFFRGAVGHACGSHYIFFQHYRAYVVAAEAEAHLADF